MLILAVPCLNAERYLEDTLRSLRGVPWWLQDACSSDGSVCIAQRLAMERCQIASQPDDGQADALNHAFGRMGGDVIGYLNADDLLSPGAAKTILDSFDSNPDVDIIYGEVQWIDEEGRVTGRHAGQISTLEEVLDIYNVWWANRQWVQPEVFFRRRVWDRVGPFNTNYNLAFDFEYWVRCFEAGMRVMRIPQVLAQFRIHPAQKSADAKAAACEIRDIVQATLERDPPISELTKKRLQNQLSYDRYQAGQGYESGERPAFLRELLRNPGWFRVPAARSRLKESVKIRIGSGL